MGAFVDLSGMRYGQLVVLNRSFTDQNQKIHWECLCDCGNITHPSGNSLNRGLTTSCGCFRSFQVSERMTTHGETKTRLYEIWRSMNSRCYREKNKSYKNYGGRGITICDEWRESYKSFRDWAVANGYENNLTIDRIDHNGNYSSLNCRWVDRTTQNNNTRRNVFIEHDDKNLTISQWARELNMPVKRLESRAKRRGRVPEILIKEKLDRADKGKNHAYPT